MRGRDEPRDERRGRDETMSRREWLADGAKAGLGAAALGFGVGAGCQGPGGSLEERPPGPDDDLGPLPTRLLGRTGERVTILGLGTACMGEGPQSTDECVRVFSEAIDRGVRYVDTARIYRNAETALGQVLRTRREEVFLVTKCMTDSREEAQKSFETSLRELQVESVDLLHLHSTGGRDIDQVLGAGAPGNISSR